MSEILTPTLIVTFMSGLFGAFFGAAISFVFGNRQIDRTRKKDLQSKYLVEAFLAMMDFSRRDPNDAAHKVRVAELEKALATVFLYGNDEAIRLLRELKDKTDTTGDFDLLPLALHLSNTLRGELSLNPIEDIIQFRGGRT